MQTINGARLGATTGGGGPERGGIKEGRVGGKSAFAKDKGIAQTQGCARIGAQSVARGQLLRRLALFRKIGDVVARGIGKAGDADLRGVGGVGEGVVLPIARLHQVGVGIGASGHAVVIGI